MKTTEQTTLNVPQWANNANKLASVRNAQQQCKQEQERKHAQKVMLLIAYFVASIVLYGWLNTIG